MDDATWLAAELDADTAACRTAIAHKRQQAEERGKPWVNVTRMVRDVIGLDEWRPLVEKHKPAAPRVTARQCESRDPHARHQWQDRLQPHMCLGVDEVPALV